MNFFESQLRRLFGDTEDARFIGRCCFIPADDGNLVKAEFVTQGVHEEYVALQMSVIKVIVNHGGSVITNEPIALGEDGYIALSDENYPNFMGDTRTLAAFMGGDFPSQGLDLTM